MHQATCAPHSLLAVPGLDNDIDNVVSQCQAHNDRLIMTTHTKEPLITKPHPSHPIKELVVDFCYHGDQCYLVIMDCNTDWQTAAPMGKSANTTDLITVLKELFACTAVPDIFWSVGGPQFSSNQLQQFATQ